MNLFTGSIETTQFFKQTHFRSNKSRPGRPKRQYSDYAFNWKFATPEAVRDQFATVLDITKTQKMVGFLDIYAYLHPYNKLYFEYPGKPVAMYSYAVKMDRIDCANDTLYPFVALEDGPVELDQFFGY
eukprot:gene2232-2670_t